MQLVPSKSEQWEESCLGQQKGKPNENKMNAKELGPAEQPWEAVSVGMEKKWLEMISFQITREATELFSCSSQPQLHPPFSHTHNA